MNLPFATLPSRLNTSPDTPASPGNSGSCNLIFVYKNRANYPNTFRKIAGYIRELDPGIRTFIIKDKHQWCLLPRLMLHPTLIFCPVDIRTFKPWRGQIFCGRKLTKSEEYTALEKSGFPVPRWQLLETGVKPDLSTYGPYVVTKPNRGIQGAFVRIRRRGRVRGENVTLLGASEPSPLLVQDFIYTGLWPISYRVTSLFGKTLFSLKHEGSHKHLALNGPDDFIQPDGKGNRVIVATGRNCTIQLNSDEEIIRFGESVHAAFPDIPLLGVDVLREAGTGKLYVSEVNAIGVVWGFADTGKARMELEFGFDMEKQFDGLHLAARILAEKTRQLAS